jgi:hypothetical protein
MPPSSAGKRDGAGGGDEATTVAGRVCRRGFNDGGAWRPPSSRIGATRGPLICFLTSYSTTYESGQSNRTNLNPIDLGHVWFP